MPFEHMFNFFSQINNYFQFISYILNNLLLNKLLFEQIIIDQEYMLIDNNFN